MLERLLTSLGWFLLGAGVFSLVKRLQRRRRWRRTRGVVTAITKRFDGESWMRTPVVRFTTEDGREIEFAEAVSTNVTLLWHGTRVDVIYDPERPQRAGIMGWREFFPPILLFVAAAMLLGWTYIE